MATGVLPNMSNVADRKTTFTGWKLNHPDAAEMAAAGFFRSGQRDQVECYACGILLEDWKENQDPMLRHRQAEFCPHLEREDDDEGVSVAGTQTTISLDRESLASGATADSGFPRAEERMDPYVDRRAYTASAITVRDHPIPRRGTLPGASAAPARFKQFDERLKSFERANWKPSLAATPDKLAKAGFYYVGPDDRVKCAYCYGKLKKWRVTDVAVEEHVKHFPDCSFVKNIEEQTAVLAKNIRSKKKTDDCVSAEELMAQYELQRESTKRHKPAELALKTLKKMKYDNSQIRRAERQLREKAMPLRVKNLLEELQMIEKEQFFAPPVAAAAAAAAAGDSEDDNLYSDDEEEEERRAMMTVTSTDELVQKLQEELKTITMDKDRLTHQITCKVCLENRVDTLFLTCRHYVTCKDCADRVRDCPLCRQVILGTVDVFMG